MGKRIVNFLLVLIELFSLVVTAEALRAKIDRKSAGGTVAQILLICLQVIILTFDL